MSELTSYYYYEDRVITPATHQYRVYHADEADKVIAEKDTEIAELKQKLEDAKATAYTDSVDAGMENPDLEESHKMEVEQLLMEIVELKAKNAQAEDDVAFWKAKAKGEM